MNLSLVQSWVVDNANLLSGLAGLVTLISIVAAPLLRREARLPRPTGADSSLPRAVAPPAESAGAQIMPLSAPVSGPGGIAVMPFDSISGDPNDAHLADGISCEIISALSRAGYVHLAPRSDSFALRGKSLSLAETAKQLAVRYVVHGSVRHDADKLRVIAEFADSTTGRQLWSKTYERQFADILKVQEEIAQAIAASLGGETFRAEVLNLAPSTNDMNAWSLTQKARHDYMLSTAPASIKDAVGLVRKALRIDPNYALAHALLAQLLMDLVSTGSAPDEAAAKAEARAAIEHALALTGRDSEVLIYAGRVWVELGEREKSVSTLRRGTQLSPHDLMEWGFLARSLAFGSQENATEAYAIAARILEIAPEHPCVWTWELFRGLACMNLERHQEALGCFRKVVEASPKFTRALLCLASALGACDQAEEASQIVARSLAINSNLTPQRFAGYVRTMSGNADTTARLMVGLRKAGLLPA